ncbi:unnamed protein product [Effrenium voratum]|uniref:Uncharacterized protein n=1 Tax=Effrenium voratum TaxID=2562239 RepID=A0AA36MI99_9DINO|nr:unnamed protein product [Effrenium voratum]
MKVFCAWLPMLVVALREKNEAELADLAEPEPAVCCVKDNPLRAAAALRASAEVAFLDLVNTGAYAFGTGLTGHLLTHCRALGVPDATCPKNVEVSSARAARAPEMLSDAAQRLQSFARSTVYWAHTPDPSKPDCGSARAGYVAGDVSRCQQEVGSFGLLAQLWGAKLANDVRLGLSSGALSPHQKPVAPFDIQALRKIYEKNRKSCGRPRSSGRSKKRTRAVQCAVMVWEPSELSPFVAPDEATQGLAYEGCESLAPDEATQGLLHEGLQLAPASPWGAGFPRHSLAPDDGTQDEGWQVTPVMGPPSNCLAVSGIGACSQPVLLADYASIKFCAVDAVSATCALNVALVSAQARVNTKSASETSNLQGSQRLPASAL